MSIPHPFVKYWTKDPATDGLEIVLVDLRDANFEKLGWTEKELSERRKHGILEDLEGKVGPPLGPMGDIDLDLPEMPGFTDIVKIKRRL